MTLMDTIEIREAIPADHAAILNLYAQPAYNGSSLDEDAAEYVFATMASYPHYVPYVSILNGEVIASLCLLIIENPAHKGLPIALVENVVVHDGYQGIGVGKAMMAYAGKVASEKGAYKLILATGANRTKAHEFYEKLGFERYGYSYGLPLREAQS
jgi:GNAT superfamily N-acetyltransferase